LFVQIRHSLDIVAIGSLCTWPEYKIKRRLPSLPTVSRSYRSLANASADWLPGTTNLSLVAICCLIRSSEHHFISFTVAIELKELAAIRHPTLMPRFSGFIVDSETSTVQTVCSFVVLEQDATIKYLFHLGAAHGRVGVAFQSPIQKSNSRYCGAKQAEDFAASAAATG
jgi:hypothetical protein